MNNISIVKSYLYVTIASILYGLIVFGGKVMGENGFSLLEIMIIPNTIVCLILLGFVYKDFKHFFKLPVWILAAHPIVAMLNQVAQYAPLFMGVSVSLTVFLLYTQPLWIIIINAVFLKNKITTVELRTCFFVITGLVLLVAPWKEISGSIIGIILAAMGGLCISLWVLFGCYYSKNNIKPLTITFFSNFYNSFPFILLSPLIARNFTDSNISSLSLNHPLILMFGVLVFSLSVFVLAHALFYKSAQKVSSVHLGLILLLEPVVGTFLDVVFLDTVFSWNMAAGGFLIILANVTLILKSAK